MRCECRARGRLRCCATRSACRHGTPAPDVAGGAGVWYRVRLEDTRRAAEEELWALRLASGDLRGLSAEIEQAALVEPWRERRWAELMIALYYEGRRAEASRTFHRVRRLFDEELGLVPGPQLLALDRAIVRDEDGTIRQVVRELAAWNHAAGSQPYEAIPVAAVPDWLTRFFGRGAERSFVVDSARTFAVGDDHRPRRCRENATGQRNLQGDRAALHRRALVRRPRGNLRRSECACGRHDLDGSPPYAGVDAARVGHRRL